MRALTVDHEGAVRLFTAQLDDFVAVVEGLSEMELLDPSRCRGWSRLDVVVHVGSGLEEMAGVAAADAARAVDHDAARYWSSHPDDRDEDPVPPILFARRTTDAYARPSSAVTHLRHRSAGSRARIAQLPDRPVAFQGKVMTSGDFVATWVVELAVHQLDLATGTARCPGLPLARATLEAVAGADLPPELDDEQAVLLGLGRVSPTPQQAALPAGNPRPL